MSLDSNILKGLFTMKSLLPVKKVCKRVFKVEKECKSVQAVENVCK